MRKNRITIRCDFCDKPIEVIPYQLKVSKHHFCNRECKGKFHSLAMQGSKNSNYRDAIKIYKCDYCGKGVKQNKNYVKEYVFCNMECKKLHTQKRREIKKYFKSLKVLCKTPSCSNLVSINTKSGLCGSCAIKEAYKNNPDLRQKASERAKERFKIPQNNTMYGKKRPDMKLVNKMIREKGLLKGKNNPNWQNGIGKLPYPFEFNNELKLKIRKRDNYTCQNPNCNITEEEYIIVFGCKLSVHHIDYDKSNCLEDNLITLCNQCNAKANFNREYWQEYYKNKIEIRK